MDYQPVQADNPWYNYYLILTKNVHDESYRGGNFIGYKENKSYRIRRSVKDTNNYNLSYQQGSTDNDILKRRIENHTRWVSFDIKFTRQGFENACWIARLCLAIQHAFSKPNLVNFISEDANLLFYLSVYKFVHFKLVVTDDLFIDFSCRFNVIKDDIQNFQRHFDPI